MSWVPEADSIEVELPSLSKHLYDGVITHRRSNEEGIVSANN